MLHRICVTVVVAAVLPGCGGGGDLLPGLTDQSTCEEVEAVVEDAIAAARTYIGTDADDPVRAGDIVFSLSAVDERPECVDEETARTASGLRTTLNDLGG